MVVCVIVFCVIVCVIVVCIVWCVLMMLVFILGVCVVIDVEGDDDGMMECG